MTCESNACRPLPHYQDGTCNSQAECALATQPSESVPDLMSGGLYDASEETLSVDMDIEEVDEGRDCPINRVRFTCHTIAPLLSGSQADERVHLSCNQQVKKHCTGNFQCINI